MLPATYDLTLYRGDTGRWQFRLWTDAANTVPADLTGVTVDAMIKDKVPVSSYSASLTCTVTLPNVIDMVLTANLSRDLPNVGVWDLQLTYLTSDIVTVLKGKVTLTQDVTFVAAAARKQMAVIKK